MCLFACFFICFCFVEISHHHLPTTHRTLALLHSCSMVEVCNQEEEGMLHQPAVAVMVMPIPRPVPKPSPAKCSAPLRSLLATPRTHAKAIASVVCVAGETLCLASVGRHIVVWLCVCLCDLCCYCLFVLFACFCLLACCFFAVETV